MKNLVNTILLLCLFHPAFSQDSLSKKTLSEVVVIDQDFKAILDSTIESYNQCKNRRKGRHFTISVEKFNYNDSITMESFYISESWFEYFIAYFGDLPDSDDAFFYYKDHLFVLHGLQPSNIFKKTGTTQMFLYRQAPIHIWDPPRWVYYYWKDKFHLDHKAPCGG